MTSERRAQVRLTVAEADSAISMRSGDVPVLATPRVVALCEEAACAALAGALDPGATSVGTWIELDHLAPSPIGSEVVAEAALVNADGRRLEFALTVTQGDAVVARGRHRRQVVDRARFLGRLGGGG
ncbi:MAG TPA: hotdog domain-containing protein [Candidatus Dormibacteraeota bacterium]